MNKVIDITSALDTGRSTVPDRTPIAQRTLKSAIGCAGVGLHSGHKIRMTLHPAAPDTGIVFRRTDLCDRPEVAARYDNVVDTRLSTVIGTPDGMRIGTIEHLMAALAGQHIDNCIVEIDGGEVPAMDGSSAPFVFMIDCAGTIDQAAPRTVIDVLRPVSIERNGCRAELLPGDGFSIDFEIAFESRVIGRQRMTVDLDDGVFARDLSRARTFGFLHEVEEMRKAGLARGGSFDNAIIVSGDGVLNDDGLRYGDEFVRHKILDAVGDLYTAGRPIRGRLRARKGGHALNNAVLRALFDDSANYRVVPFATAVGPAPCRVRYA